MANFRLMHEFVSNVRKHNLTNDQDATMVALTDDMEFLRWMERELAISTFADSHGGDKNLASEVYEEAVRAKYLHPFNAGGLLDKRLRVTPEGRNFIKKLWKFKTGMWKAWADENHNLNSLAISFVSGIVIGVAGILVAIAGLGAK